MNEVRRFSDGAGRRIPFNALSYFVAGLCALLYAWSVSLTEYRQTGLQFVTPLLVIFIVQSLWCVVTLGITPNLFSQITRRTLNTSFLLMFSVLLFSALVPQPAHGTGLEDIFSGVMGDCLFVYDSRRRTGDWGCALLYA